MTDVSSVTNTVLTTLDIGSGIDSVKLARDLTDAIQIPQTEIAQGKIDASELAISAYGLVKFQVDQLKSSFEKLNDANELATSAGTSSDSAKVTFSSLAGSAPAGSYDFTISQLAQNQRVISDQYTSTTQALNSGSAFGISLAVGTPSRRLQQFTMQRLLHLRQRLLLLEMELIPLLYRAPRTRVLPIR